MTAMVLANGSPPGTATMICSSSAGARSWASDRPAHQDHDGARGGELHGLRQRAIARKLNTDRRKVNRSLDQSGLTISSSSRRQASTLRLTL